MRSTIRARRARPGVSACRALRSVPADRLPVGDCRRDVIETHRRLSGSSSISRAIARVTAMRAASMLGGPGRRRDPEYAQPDLYSRHHELTVLRRKGAAGRLRSAGRPRRQSPPRSGDSWSSTTDSSSSCRAGRRPAFRILVPDPVHHRLVQVRLERAFAAMLEAVDLLKHLEQGLLNKVRRVGKVTGPAGEAPGRPSAQKGKVTRAKRSFRAASSPSRTRVRRRESVDSHTGSASSMAAIL